MQCEFAKTACGIASLSTHTASHRHKADGCLRYDSVSEGEESVNGRRTSCCGGTISHYGPSARPLAHRSSTSIARLQAYNLGQGYAIVPGWSLQDNDDEPRVLDIPRPSSIAVIPHSHRDHSTTSNQTG